MKNTNSPDNAPVVRNIFLHAAAVPVVFDKKNGTAVFCGLVSGYKHPVPGKDRGFDHDRAVIAPAKFSCDERRDSGAPRRTSDLSQADCFCSQRYLFRPARSRYICERAGTKPAPQQCRAAALPRPPRAAEGSAPSSRRSDSLRRFENLRSWQTRGRCRIEETRSCPHAGETQCRGRVEETRGGCPRKPRGADCFDLNQGKGGNRSCPLIKASFSCNQFIIN